MYKEKHEILKRAMEIWQGHTHSHYTDVTLRQFVGVFHATIEAIKENQLQSVERNGENGI